jgi:hypothetical protein
VSDKIEGINRLMLLTIRNHCEHPKHDEQMEAFFRKFPSADREGDSPIIFVDPKYWWVSDNPKENAAKCCMVCSISEDIKRASDPSWRNESSRS